MIAPFLLRIQALSSLSEEVRRLVVSLPGDGIRVSQFVDPDWLARNLRILFPLLAGGAVLLVVVGIVAALRNSELSGDVKAGFKREIVNLLRQHLSGLSVDELSRRIKLGAHPTGRLCEEMCQDGVLVSRVQKNVTLWRLKGIGD